MADVRQLIQLRDYLSFVSGRRFAYGSVDCCTFMADWLMRLGFSDPMPDRRKTYANYREYRAAIRTEGGLVKSCSDRFKKIGLKEVVDARPGDVGLVMAPIGVRRDGRLVFAPTGAIKGEGSLSVVVTPDLGLVGAPMARVKFWQVHA